MIKKFFLSFLGSMAAIWLSVTLLAVLTVMGVIALVKNFDEGIKEMFKSEVKNGTVLVVDLSGEIEERFGTVTFKDVMSDEFAEKISLEETVSSIYRAAHDSRVKGIYVECGGVSGGVASLQEIGEALSYFKERGKWVVAYSDNYMQGEYFAVSPANEIWLNAIGAVDIHGLTATTVFYTGLLEKLGVKMQVMRVGTFKSAVEPFTLKEMSAASRAQQESYMGSIWQAVRDVIGENRGISADKLNYLADEFTFSWPADSLKEAGVVTHVGYRHEVEQRVADLAGEKTFEDVYTLSVKQYATTFDASDFSYLPGVKSGGKTIAVLYATGDITDSGDKGISGEKMVEQINSLAAQKDELAGLILRVNSPGGSAFASEQIWEALEHFKEETGLPVYASMSDVAASGGYYISCGADVIYAEPTTITGSIGIFGMIPEIKELLNKHLGITTSTVNTNRNSNFPSLTSPMTQEQTRKMQAYIERGYDLFTKRCAAGRHMSQDSIKAIAEGRVWSGRQALENGLVDRQGSLRTAISGMASDLGLDRYTVKSYPEAEESFWDYLLLLDDMEMPTGGATDVSADAIRMLKKIEELKKGPKIQCRMEDIIIN